jgi:hypothetical protein
LRYLANSSGRVWRTTPEPSLLFETSESEDSESEDSVCNLLMSKWYASLSYRLGKGRGR